MTKKPFLTLKDAFCFAVVSLFLAGLIVALSGRRAKPAHAQPAITSEDVETLARTIRVANAEDRAEKRLVSDSWLDDLGDCNADINCRAQVAKLKPRRKQ